MPKAIKPPDDQFDYTSSTEPLSVRELYEEFLLALAENPDHIAVSEERTDTEIRLTAVCHPDDVGKIVGRNGACLQECTRLLNRIEGRRHMKVSLHVPRIPR